jgi:hypothetical protein
MNAKEMPLVLAVCQSMEDWYFDTSVPCTAWFHGVRPCQS